MNELASHTAFCGIDHIGIAVKDLEQALQVWRDVFGLEVTETKTVDSEGIRAAFLQLGDIRIELMEAFRDDCAVARFIGKRGEGIQHIAVSVSDVAGATQSYEDANLWVEKVLCEDNQLAFLHPVSCNGITIELVPLKKEEL